MSKGLSKQQRSILLAAWKNYQAEGLAPAGTKLARFPRPTWRRFMQRASCLIPTLRI